MYFSCHQIINDKRFWKKSNCFKVIRKITSCLENTFVCKHIRGRNCLFSYISNSGQPNWILVLEMRQSIFSHENRASEGKEEKETGEEDGVKEQVALVLFLNECHFFSNFTFSLRSPSPIFHSLTVFILLCAPQIPVSSFRNWNWKRKMIASSHLKNELNFCSIARNPTLPDQLLFNCANWPFVS